MVTSQICFLFSMLLANTFYRCQPRHPNLYARYIVYKIGNDSVIVIAIIHLSNGNVSKGFLRKREMEKKQECFSTKEKLGVHS